MNPHDSPVSRVLRDNPHVSLAYVDHQSNPPTLHITTEPTAQKNALALPDELQHHRLSIHISEPLKILIAHPGYETTPLNGHQHCQDPPIQLGCQVQPENANWVGTAGCPARWTNHGHDNWGFLTNWHVAAAGDKRVGRLIYQPDTSRPPIATLDTWKDVDPNKPNLIDAALCNSMLSEFHSTSELILEIGKPRYPFVDAQIGHNAIKSGRTTGLTRGRCVAVGASARVGYGSFTAQFDDQDVYEGNAGSFSAAGDSGSLILHADTLKPTSLLFAGGGGTTIGNPIRHVAQALLLRFPFP